MGFIETLNKFGYKIPVTKTKIYKQIDEAKASLEAMGLNVKIKNEFDLFDYEVIYKGMVTQNQIENAYEIFLAQNYDLFHYLNYDEKRKMFNNDIVEILENAPYFYCENSESEIYIPYLEPFVNQRYINDYQLMTLKQHRDYVKNYKITTQSPQMLYHRNMYLTDFSSLQNVYEDERHICYYYESLKTIYIFKKENNELLNQVIICDHENEEAIDLDIVKTIAYDIETYLYKDCLELMKEKNLISEKTYKKVLKKYK